LRVDRDVTHQDGRVLLHDTRYFLTSLDPGQVRADQLLAMVRAHWQIENSLFFVKDRWWDEDRHWTRRPGVADWLTQLTTAALTVLRACTVADEPLRARADRIAWNPARGLALLGLT
jgi:predicted transposase YbfD/YdcC